MAIKKEFLPIGTVVKLKDDDSVLMIVSYSVHTDGVIYDKTGKKSGKKYIFDYAACGFPEGIVRSDRMMAFNHDQIEKILFKGYMTKESKKVADLLEKIDAQKEKQEKKSTDKN